MAFKVRNQRNDDGTYTLSYGKGGNKLSATMQKVGGKWDVWIAKRLYSGGHATMKKAKAAWGAWAEQNYGGKTEGAALAAPALPPPPSLEPPSLGDEYLDEMTKRLPPDEDDVQPAFRDPDPFDPAFRDTPGGPLKPLGALDAVYSWMRGHQHQVLHPTLNILMPPWDQVYQVLRRELGEERYPEIKK